MKPKTLLITLLVPFLVFAGASFVWALFTVWTNTDKTLIAAVEGRVQLKKEGGKGWTDAEPDAELAKGDVLKTGRKSRVDIHLPDGSLLRLKGVSDLIVGEIDYEEGDRRVITLFLPKGFLVARVKAVPEAGAVRFVTPTAKLIVKDAVLSLRHTMRGSLSMVRVLKGEVKWGGEKKGSPLIAVPAHRGSSFDARKGRSSRPEAMGKREIGALDREVGEFRHATGKHLASEFLYILSSPVTLAKTILGLDDADSSGGSDMGIIGALMNMLRGEGERRAVKDLQRIFKAIGEYIGKNGRLPRSLDDLWTLKKPDLIDPWGQPYKYEPSLSDDSSFVLSSSGPDRKFGTKDDIVKVSQVST